MRHGSCLREFLDARPGGRRLAGARRLALQWVEGFHAADPRVASVHALADGGWPADDFEERRLSRVIDGYDHVVEWLATPLAARIRLGAAVIAVPLGVLNASSDDVGAIAFVPALDRKQQALNLLAVGSVVRVVVRLRERFWAPEYDNLSLLHSRDSDFPTWWTNYPMRTPIIVGWCGGPRARRLSQLPVNQLESRAVTSLGAAADVAAAAASAR